MSDLPNSVTYMTQVIRNGLHERESFHKFFECWIVEQDQHLQELISASREYEEQPERRRAGGGEGGRMVELLLRRMCRIQLYVRFLNGWSSTTSITTGRNRGGRRATSCPCSTPRGGAAWRMRFCG
ncbi:UNVERIFIED_CONTAM: hypothetical protein Sradi_3126100 [Sesamum radiatum]|uniref:Uncharacterized protein n=1 Tax=Sesamum radiatum TaxID=300843 RepID=A0AAW2RF06_SESRA